MSMCMRVFGSIAYTVLNFPQFQYSTYYNQRIYAIYETVGSLAYKEMHNTCGV